MCSQSIPVNSVDRAAFSRRQRRAALLGLALAMPAYATDRIWNKSYGVWSDQSSWSPVGWPAVTDHVFIGSTPETIDADSDMDVNATIAALDVVARADLENEGRRLTVNGPVRIDGNNMGLGVGYEARIFIIDSASAIDFQADSLEIVSEAVLAMDDGPTVSVDGAVLIGPEGRLVGNGVINVGGAFTNSGEIQVFGGQMTINVTNGAAIDLDGGGNSEIVLNRTDDLGADLSIVASAVTDPYDGHLFIGGESLLSVSVGGGWTLGTASHTVVAWVQSNGHESTIQGAPLSIGGAFTINGIDNTLRVQCDTTIAPTAAFDFYDQLNDGESNFVQFNGETTVAGGQFDLSPDSRIQFTDTTTVNGGTFVLDDGANIDFDGPTTIHGGSFSTFSTLLGDGTVDFNGPTEWAGTVEIDGIARQQGAASVTGATVINAGVFDMNVTSNNWNIPQSLTINAGALGIGGNGVGGAINVTGGTAGRLTVNLDGPGESWSTTGSLNLGPLAGGAHLPVIRVAGAPIVVSGTVNVDTGRPRITAPVTLLSSADVNVVAGTAELRLDSVSTIASAVTFQGAGTLVAGPAGDLTLASGVNTADVGLSNQGVLRIGSQAGIASVDRFATSGTWQVQIGGPDAGAEHDRLIVANGTAQLGGQMQIRLIDLGSGVFTPQVGDEFTVLISLGAVSGTFAGSPRTFSQGQRFDWTVLYGSNDVTLRLDSVTECAPGDLDDDGDVDLQDLAILLANFGTLSGAQWADGDVDGDGDVELQDLAILLANFGASCA